MRGMANMETVLKQHNQIELPREICRKLELMPGIRLDIELDSATGKIILVPILKGSTGLRKKRVNIHSAKPYK